MYTRLPRAVSRALRLGLGGIDDLRRRPPPGIGVLIVSPSRELALQIARDAQALLTYHALQVLALVGGAAKSLH
eukprot:562014-Amphidinium_carterae.1